MSAITSIEWCNHTFNAWEGCTKVGPGCQNCYAEARNIRYHHGKHWGPGAPRLLRSDAYWREPLKWNERAMLAGKRVRVFCASLADVFDNEAPEGQRERLWRLIEATPHLDWLLLTKRIGNALKMLPDNFYHATYPNVWIGATVVTQEEADRDIPKLLAIPAAVRFLSMEPLIEPVIITPYLLPRGQAVQWVIVGGESGPQARPMHPQWARNIRDQSVAQGVAFFFKQWGAWWEVDWPDDETTDADSELAREIFDAKTDCLITLDGRVFRDLEQLPADEPARLMTRLGKKRAGRTLDGREWSEFPA